MARKTAKTAETLADFEPTKEELELDEFLQEVGPSTAVIHILRMKPDGSKPQIGKTTMDQIREDPWEFLRSSYGGGKFCLLFRGSNREFQGSKVIEVEGPPLPAGQAASSPGGLSHEKLLDTMLIAMIENMRPQPAPAPLDVGALFAGMASMMTVLKPPAPTEKPPDPIQMFQTIMTMYQGMKDKNEKPPLEQLRDVAGVIKEFSSDGGKDTDSMWGAVASIGKDVIEKGSVILSNMQGRPPGPAPQPFRPGPLQPQPQPPAPAALPTASETKSEIPPSPGTVVAPAGDNIEKWIRIQIAGLKEKAKLNKDPGFWIEYILENEEEHGCAALLYAVRQGATLQNLLAFDPEIGSNPQLVWWFSEVFEGVKAGLNQPMDTGRESGDTRDDLPDVAPRVAGSNGTGSVVAGGPVPDTDVH